MGHFGFRRLSVKKSKLSKVYLTQPRLTVIAFRDLCQQN